RADARDGRRHEGRGPPPAERAGRARRRGPDDLERAARGARHGRPRARDARGPADRRAVAGGGRRGARDARGDGPDRGGGGMTADAARPTPQVAGGEARRLADWVFRVRELGIVAAFALLMLVTA